MDIKKKPLVEHVEDALFEYILKKPVEIGDKLPNEYELGKLFGVGRSTIREAVKSLASEGILEVRRGAGTYVISTRKKNEDPLELSKRSDKYKLTLELMEIRLMIEPEIAALACDNATEADLELLKHLCNEVEKICIEGKDHTAKDTEFHNCIARCSKNQIVEKLLPIINTSVTAFIDITEQQLVKETITTHREITDAIIHRDPVGARCAMIMHLTYNRQMIMKMQRKN